MTDRKLVPAAFLDRDGTLIRDYDDQDWAGRVHPEWLPGAISAATEIAAMGFRLVIITNQYIIGEGIVTEGEYRQLTAALLSVLRPVASFGVSVYHCPHPRWESCHCAKPGTGLIEQACTDFPNIDLANSILVGDAITDVMLGSQLGIETYGIRVGGPPEWGTRVDSLAAATVQISQRRVF